MRAPEFVDTGLGVSQRLAAVGLLYVLFAVYLRAIVIRVQPGLQRVLLALPVIATNFAVPWAFNMVTEVLPRTSLLFTLTWLCTFKVLGMCLGRGPVLPSMTAPQMAATMLLPIFPKPLDKGKAQKLEGRLHDSAGSNSELMARWVSKLVMLGVIVYGLVALDLPRVPKDLLYSFGMYAFVGFLMDGPAAVFAQSLGLDIVPTFDQPWLSTSLADFWGRRWNVTTSSTLRTLVYDIIVEGSFVKQPRSPASPSHAKTAAAPAPACDDDHHGQQQQQRLQNGHEHRPRAHHHHSQQDLTRRRSSLTLRTLGACATFFVSGVVHEYMMWNIAMDGAWRWKWTLFFTIQGPMLIMEQMLGKWAAKAQVPELPAWLRTLLTLTVLETGGYFLFFAPCEIDTDIADRVVAACKANYLAIITMVAGDRLSVSA